MSEGVGEKCRKVEKGKKIRRRKDKRTKMSLKKIKEMRKLAINLNLVCFEAKPLYYRDHIMIYSHHKGSKDATKNLRFF